MSALSRSSRSRSWIASFSRRFVFRSAAVTTGADFFTFGGSKPGGGLATKMGSFAPGGRGAADGGPPGVRTRGDCGVRPGTSSVGGAGAGGGEGSFERCMTAPRLHESMGTGTGSSPGAQFAAPSGSPMS